MFRIKGKAAAGKKTEPEKGKQPGPGFELSPDALLAARFRFGFVWDRRKRAFLAWESITDLTLVFLAAANAALILLCLAAAGSFFGFFDNEILFAFRYLNLTLAALIAAFDVFIAARLAIMSLFSGPELKNGKRAEFYFLREGFAYLSYAPLKPDKADDGKSADGENGETDAGNPDTPDPEAKPMETVYSYSDIRKIRETRHFFVIGLFSGQMLYVFKPGMNRRHTLDEIRGMLSESSGRMPSISRSVSEPRYEVNLADFRKKTRLREFLLSLLMLEFMFLLFPPVFVNFRSGLVLDSIWLFWTALSFALAVMLTGFIVWAKEASLRKISRLVIGLSSLLAVFSLAMGIAGNLYVSLTTFGRAAEPFLALNSGIDLPETTKLDYSNTSSLKDSSSGLFRDETAAYLTDANEIASFEQGLDSDDSVWKTLLDNDEKNTLPSCAHLSICDHFVIFSGTADVFFPTASASADDQDMWYLCYSKDRSEIFMVNYNLNGGFVLPVNA